jgi:hypothetical protein
LFRFPPEDQEEHEIRLSLNQELVLGRDEFKDKIEQIKYRYYKSNTPSKSTRKTGGGIPREMFIDQIVNEFGVDFRETINKSVDIQVALADRLAGHGPGDLIDVSDF